MTRVLKDGNQMIADLAYATDLLVKGGNSVQIFPAWAEAGTNVLFHAVVETAEIVD